MLIAKYLFKLLKAISSEAEPWQLASGFILGMIIGLTPLLSLHNLLLLSAVLLLKVNIGIAILALSVFSGVAYLADPLFDFIGYQLLTADSLKAMWTWLYNKPAFALSNFYNTVVLGSFISALVLTVPAYPGIKKFVIYYRDHIHQQIQKWKIVQVLKSSKLYSLYQNVNKFGGS